MTEVNVKLDINDDELYKIDEIKNRLGLDNNAEVVAYGLSLLIRMIDELNNGHRIKVKSSKTICKIPNGYAIFEI